MNKFFFLLLLFSACQNSTPPAKTQIRVMQLDFDLTPSETVVWVNGPAKEGDTIWVWNAYSAKLNSEVTYVGKYDHGAELCQPYIYKKIKQ